MYVLNFYSPVFIDQLKRGRKTATIRLGNKSSKYKKGEVVLVTVGFQHSPREKIFEAVIDAVDVKRVADLSPRDIEHDNPEFRRLEETVHFLEQIYGRKRRAARTTSPSSASRRSSSARARSPSACGPKHPLRTNGSICQPSGRPRAAARIGVDPARCHLLRAWNTAS